MARRLNGRAVIPGSASGEAVVSSQALSFWGGISVETGEVTDGRHECHGRIVKDRVFVFPQGKGSSTGSAVLLECIKAGTAPAAIINVRTSPILALGSIVADEMYGKFVPIVVLPKDAFDLIRDGDIVSVEPDGTVIVEGPGHDDA